MTIKVTFRHAQSEDINDLCDIINNAYCTPKSWTNTCSMVKGLRISREELKHIIYLKHDMLIVACVASNDTKDEKIVGCICAESFKYHPELNLPKDSALVGLFSVSPAFQSQGIGKKLFKEILERVKVEWNMHKVFLWVLEPRIDIIQWYERMGFSWTGAYKSFSGSPTEKPLTSNMKFKILSRDV